MTAGALDGLRVLDLSNQLSGPYCAMLLGDLGADVIKVEHPVGGDPARLGAPHRGGESAPFMTVNRNKRSITVDLKDKASVAWVVELAGQADVLVQNLRPGALDELGLGPTTLIERYPRLIYCSVWAFGARGPLKLKPGYEPMVQAFSGLMMMNGDEGGPPTRIGTSILDYGTGMWAAMGTLAALVRRERTGRGGVVDASLFETGLAWLKGHHASFRASGAVPERHRTGSNRVVPFQAFETKTGPLIVAAGNDRLFVKLAGVLGHPEWVKDPRFVTNAARVEHRAMLCAMIDEIFATRPKGEWIDRLEADGVPCAVINSLPDAAAHAQTAALDMIQPMPGDDFALVALPLSFDGRRPRIHRAPPAIGQHNSSRDRPARWPEG